METAVDADAVAIDGGRGLVKGEGGDRSGHVRTDTGDRKKKVGLGRELAMEMLADILCPAHEIPRAGIIAEPFPEFQHFIFRSVRQRSGIRKSVKKPRVVVQNGGDACLLEHRFGDPGGIRRSFFTPRKDPAVIVKPGKQGRGDL